MAVGRYCWCYVAWCGDCIGSLLAMFCSLKLRWLLVATVEKCSLMLGLQLIAGGDVMQLDVEMRVGRYWWCYVAWCCDGSLLPLLMLCSLMLRWVVGRFWWCYVAPCWDGFASLLVMLRSLRLRMTVGRWWWCYLAWRWDGSWSLLVKLYSLRLIWQLVCYWWCYVAGCWDGSY